MMMIILHAVFATEFNPLTHDNVTLGSFKYGSSVTFVHTGPTWYTEQMKGSSGEGMNSVALIALQGIYE